MWPQFDLRYARLSGLRPLIIGSAMTWGTVLLLSKQSSRAFQSGGRVFGLLIIVAVLACGLALVVRGLKRVFDRGVVLSLTGDAITDHRNGSSVQWDDFRGIRLHAVTANGMLRRATMYVQQADGMEVAFPLEELDQPYQVIAELTQKYALARV
jgi:hypothetical protein